MKAKTTGKYGHKASVMRLAAVCALMLFGVVNAQADDGDQWEDHGANGGGYYDRYKCLFEVVDESKAQVKIIAREGKNTFSEDTNTYGITYLNIYTDVIHNKARYTVVEIGDSAFMDMPNLQVLHIGDSIHTIGIAAFMNCPKLESVRLPEELVFINGSAFMDCKALKCTIKEHGDYDSELRLPEKLRGIFDNAFRNCSSLESVIFPDSLSKITNAVFFNCASLGDISLPNGLNIWNPNCFSACPQMKNINVRYVSDEINLYSEGGVLFRQMDDGSHQLLKFPCGRTGSYVIPDFVSSLGYNAFEYSNLSSLTIPITVKQLHKNSFFCMYNLTSVYVEWVDKDDLPYIMYADGSPFQCYAEAPERTLYVPNDAGAFDTYMTSDWNTWFYDIKKYDVGYVDGLTVGGCRVKRTQVKNIDDSNNSGFVQGRASYDLTTHTLTLDNAIIQTSQNDCYGVGNEGIDNLIIQLNGTCDITTNAVGLYLSRSTIINGPGTLYVSSNSEEAIYVDYWNLYVNNATLGLYGSCGAIAGDGQAYVYVWNSDISMSPTDSEGMTTVSGIAKFELDNGFFCEPRFAQFDADKQTVVDWNGIPTKGKVTVQPGEFYGFYVGDVPVTSRSTNNISPAGLKNGYINYSPSENTLSLTNVEYTGEETFLASNNDFLHVMIRSNNTIHTTDDCFWLLDDMYIKGSGTLTTNADMGVAVRIERPDTWLYLWDTDANLKGAGGAIYGRANCEKQALYVKNSHVKLSGSGRYKVTSELNHLYLDDAQFLHDYFYFDEDQGYICDERYYGDPVYTDEIEIIATGAPTALETFVYDAAQPRLTEPVYNLQGQRVGDSYRGIIIKNGKKTINK